MMSYKRRTIVDGKIGWVAVDENGTVVNKYPSQNKLKGLRVEIYKMKPRNGGKIYTDDELLGHMKSFSEKNGKIPVQTDFAGNPGYPNFMTYVKRFGSWSNALKIVKMDIDTIIRQGHLDTIKRRSRWFEIMVYNYFKKESTDLSGENCNNTIDGICPNGHTYEVKYSSLYVIDECWRFDTRNMDKGDDNEAIQWYYFGAFNEDYTELLYVWRVPGEVVDANVFRVGIRNNHRFNIENMKKYDITEEFKKSLDKNYFLDKKADNNPYQ